MNNTIDAKGLSCPQPVILTLNAIKKAKTGELIVLVDTQTSKENVSRAATAKGWKVEEVQAVNDSYKIILRKEN
ncbi:MAG: sulfurtransferase TusA family protein [Gudongella sp.]|nr:sulfurtransferase TusA family protein [Gudongella sp.]